MTDDIDRRGWDEMVHPPSLLDLMLDPTHQELAVPVLQWLKSCVAERLGEALQRAEIDVISLRYLGAYPVIAVRLLDRTPDETQLEFSARAERLAKLVEVAAEEVLRSAQLVEFLRFAAASPRRWSEVARELLAPDRFDGKEP